QALDRRPDCRHAGLVARPAQKLLVGPGVDRVGIGVIGAELQLFVHGDGNESLHTLGGGFIDVYQRTAQACRIKEGVDEISELDVEIGRSEADAIVEQRLLEAGIITSALLRLEVRIGEEVEFGKVDEQLSQGRRLETSAEAGLELGL